MNFKKHLNTALAIGALTFTANVFAMPSYYYDVGAVGSDGDAGFIDADTISTVFDGLVFDLTSPLTPVGSGLAVGLIGAVDGNDSEGMPLFTDFTLSYDLGAAIATLWFEDNATSTLVANQKIIDFTITNDSLTGFDAFISTVYVDNFFFLDNGNGVAGDAGDTGVTQAYIDDLAALATPQSVDVRLDASNSSADLYAVPEPSIVALFGLGLAGLGFAARKRKQA